MAHGGSIAARHGSFCVTAPCLNKRLVALSPEQLAGMADRRAGILGTVVAEQDHGREPRAVCIRGTSRQAGAGCSCLVAASRGWRHHDLSTRDGVRADADPVAFGAGRPWLESEEGGCGHALFVARRSCCSR